MGHSSLLGTELAEAEAAGRDSAALGPSDSSDSASDMMGVVDADDGGPDLPVDVAVRDNRPPPLLLSSSLREAVDIGVDRIVRRRAKGRGAIANAADLAIVDDAQAGDPLEDEDTDDEAMVIESGPTTFAVVPPPLPGQHPNPEPDLPDPEPEDDDLPDDDGDEEEHHPGRV